MEPKYRTLVQAAVIIMALAVIVHVNTNDKGQQAIAQKTMKSRG